MTVGAVVLATEQGLGYLAKDFYDNGIINKVLIHPHSTRQNHREWYAGSDIVSTQEELIDQCDTLLFFEEVWQWQIIPQARAKGKKTVLMPMYECTRNPLPYEPDLILAPSLLDLEYYKDKKAVFLPVPTNGQFRLRTNAQTFVHNAGNGGLGGRNGTADILQAMALVQSPIKLIIRSQSLDLVSSDPRVEIRRGTVPFEELWNEGDVFLFPERFNGLSLPLQEAYASGMLVMAGDRFPINTWLPKEPLIPVDHYVKERIAVEFDSARYAHGAIATYIDFWYGLDITRFSQMGKDWGEQHSWQHLKEKYLEVLSP